MIKTFLRKIEEMGEKAQKKELENIERYTIPKLKIFVTETIDEILKQGIDDKGIDIDEYNSRQIRKNTLRAALRDCAAGNKGHKEFVKMYIIDLITQVYGVNENNIDSIIKFKHLEKLTIQDKFDIVLYMYKKQFGYDSLKHLLKDYGLDKLREINGTKKYAVTKEDIENIYANKNYELSFVDKIEILTQRIYSIYKGNGCVDEIRDMKINGLSIGVSGVVEEFEITTEIMDKIKAANKRHSYDAIWLYFEGKEIHLDCLSFKSYKEQERVCKILYHYNNPGQFSQSKGFIINTLADGSRCTTFRPPFCETWISIIRKFDEFEGIEELISGQGSDVVIELEDYLVKGTQCIAYTGDQGAGKTTHIKAMVSKIYDFYTIRVWESFFETQLRNIYPQKNIITVTETETISGTKGLSIIRKSNGIIGIIGEAVEDQEVAYIVKSSRVANKCMYYSHHALTFKDLVKSEVNSLLALGIHSDAKAAEEDVISVMDWNIHIGNVLGERYISRITECVPIKNEEEYPIDYRTAEGVENKLTAFMDTMLVYFKKITERDLYKDVNIIEYNFENKVYEVKNRISKDRLVKIRANLLEEDKLRFDKFIDKYFSRLECD